MIEFETSVQGAPCIVVVTHHHYTKPNPSADSSEDFHGGWETDWHLYDIRGTPAPWIEAMVTDEDRMRIEQEIIGELS